jgi:hypothetical protein
MPNKNFASFLLLPSLLFSSWTTNDDTWQLKKNKSFSLFYTTADKNNIEEYEKLITNGIKSVNTFFNEPYQNKFDVYIYPDRKTLDSAWSKDWNMPGFKSECWMVASGVAKKIDIIAPKNWDKEACEHKYSDTASTQRLLTHELFHVFHAQLNVSPDFSNTENIDWFVEGLATYASGQLNAERIDEIKKNISAKTIPASLDDFWTGKLKYGLSGSVIMYIDKQFGRSKLKELLKYNKKTEILQSLNITEDDLLNNWKNLMATL